MSLSFVSLAPTHTHTHTHTYAKHLEQLYIQSRVKSELLEYSQGNSAGSLILHKQEESQAAASVPHAHI